jgi:sortase (surface protein transpeptidase)
MVAAATNSSSNIAAVDAVCLVLLLVGSRRSKTKEKSNHHKNRQKEKKKEKKREKQREKKKASKQTQEKQNPTRKQPSAHAGRLAGE